jgi:hypothetical protein
MILMGLIQKIPSALVLEYEGLFKLGIKGILVGELDEVSALLVEDMGFEVAPVISQPQRNFLAVFALRQPIVDLTVDLYGGGASAIVAWGLDADRAASLIEKIVKGVSFSPDTVLDATFERTFTEEFSLDRVVYDRCRAISKFSGGRRSVGDLFAVLRYGNFLHQYKGVPDDQALQTANEMYGCPLP